MPDEGEGGPAELGVIGDDDDAAGRPHEGGVDGGLALVGGVDAAVVHALHAEEQGADGDLGEDEGGQGAGEFVGAGAGGAAGDHDAHALAHGELAGYVDGIGHDGDRRLRVGQVRQQGDLARHLRGGGAPVEPDRVPRAHHGGGGAGDARLLLAHAGGPVAQGQLGGGGVGRRPSTGAGDQLLLGEQVEVPPGGGRGDAEPLGDVIDVDGSLLDDHAEDGGEAFVSGHRCSRVHRSASRLRGLSRGWGQHRAETRLTNPACDMR